jgi:hypothetical protein
VRPDERGAHWHAGSLHGRFASAELSAGLEAALLKADAGVIAAFAPEKARVYDTAPPWPPRTMPRRYVIVGPVPRRCRSTATDVAESEVTLDVWSLSDPAGQGQGAMSHGRRRPGLPPWAWPTCPRSRCKSTTAVLGPVP